MQKLDGCPKCTARDNAPRTWDEEAGRGDYTCRTCGHSWTTHWEVPGRRSAEPVSFGALVAELLGDNR